MSPRESIEYELKIILVIPLAQSKLITRKKKTNMHTKSTIISIHD